ncbi:hypothetical protein [Streptomyces sp. NPDC051211]|uniref:hypothetical protein n=1 Tax=Streptomyces sp. NPDC051211 TaxID=3154643 RepID=UPI00344F5AF0
MSNCRARRASGLVIEAQTSGALEVRALPESGTFNGFTCTALTVSAEGDPISSNNSQTVTMQGQ